jgi:hypothetical protein
MAAMIPSVEMTSACLRCGASLEPAQRICASCGADRDVEVAMKLEVEPAIRWLRIRLALLAAWHLVWALVLYDDLGRGGLEYELTSMERFRFVLPVVLVGVVSLVLCGLARRAPLVVSVVALVFVGGLVLEGIIEDPTTLFRPFWWAGVQFAIVFALVQGVIAGRKARALRQQLAERVAPARVV